MKTAVNRYRYFRLLLLLLISGITAATGQTNDPWADSLSNVMQSARKNNLPVEALENKIREGRAKGRSSKEIFTVIQKRKTVLSEIAREHNGTVPTNYQRELYTREQPLLQRQSKPSHPVATRKYERKKTCDLPKTETGSDVTTPRDNSTAKKSDTNTAKVQKQIAKQIKKA